jgi:RNA polymerase sigma factor (TIGR02999 family)
MPQFGDPAQERLPARAADAVGATADAGSDQGEVTRLLRSAAAGDRAALDRVLPLLYDDLRRLARRQLARESGSPPVQPTTLVHEAYLKLAGSTPRAEDRAHLLAIAAHAMRQVLVDHARERRAAKRGPAWVRTTLTSGAWSTDLDPDTLLALDEALGRLEPRQRQVVECRFFGGFEDAEIAAALGVTTRTVRRDWVKARAWLNRWLGEGVSV